MMSSNDNEERSIYMVLLEQRREKTRIKMEAQKRSIKKTFNKAFRKRSFKIRNLVLRKSLDKKLESMARN